MTQPAHADNQIEKNLAAAVARGDLSGLHTVLVTREGDTLAEIYFPGEDEAWGRKLGPTEHTAETLHDLRSVTKSVVGLLYGIALGEGRVPATDAPLIGQFSDYADLANDSDRATILVQDALTMQMGTTWNEDLPYTSAENSEIAMELAEDRYRFVLDRPMVEKPGERWVYNGGATAIVAKLIADGTGQPIDAYAKANLFDPLGIETFEWMAGEDGVPSAASGLRLRARDLAKIGRLVAQGGVWDGQQIVAADWIAEMLTPRAEVGDGLRYGYFWWLAPGSGAPDWVAGFGNGGQRLTIGRKTGTVIVVYAGNYNAPHAWQVPVSVARDFVVPALTGQQP